MKHAAGLLLLLVLLPSMGCDKATPVAPGGTILTLSANPTKIGLTGRSTITVIGRRPDGNPLNPGTEIRLTADKGTIESVVAVDDRGQATATLRADGRAGPALIKASAADATVETTVQIGESTETKPTLLLSVNPSTIPVNGTATITVIARNADGSPVSAGQQVILTSTLGAVSPSRPQTRTDGTATATLTVGNQAGTAKVTAVLGSSDAATADVVVKDAIITLIANPSSIPEQDTSTIVLIATVKAFQGDPLKNRAVKFRSDRGTLDLTSENTDEDGEATVHLTVQAEAVTGPVTFQVTASTDSGSGEPLTATVTITILNNIL